MAGQFKYNRKVVTTITQGRRKGDTYTRYFYGPRPGTIAASVKIRRDKVIKKMEGQRDKLMIEFTRTGNKRVERKLKSIRSKIAQLNEMTRQGVF
jgi:hypothetical protein